MGLVDKSDIFSLIDNSDLDKKIATSATKAELKSEQRKTTKLQAFDSSYFRLSHFDDYDRMQNCLVFQLVHKYFNIYKYFGDHILA